MLWWLHSFSDFQVGPPNRLNYIHWIRTMSHVGFIPQQDSCLGLVHGAAHRELPGKPSWRARHLPLQHQGVVTYNTYHWEFPEFFIFPLFRWVFAANWARKKLEVVFKNVFRSERNLSTHSPGKPLDISEQFQTEHLPMPEIAVPPIAKYVWTIRLATCRRLRNLNATTSFAAQFASKFHQTSISESWNGVFLHPSFCQWVRSQATCGNFRPQVKLTLLGSSRLLGDDPNRLV